MKAKMAPTGTTVARLNGLLLRFSVLLWLRTTLSQYQTSFPVEGWLQRYPDSLVSFILVPADRHSIRCR